MVEGKQLKARFLARCEPESLEPQASREGKPAYLDRWHRLKTERLKVLEERSVAQAVLGQPPSLLPRSTE